jgi:hypothetical protein
MSLSNAHIPQLVAAQSAFSARVAVIRHTIGEDCHMTVAGLLLARALLHVFSYSTAALTLASPGNACS